MDPKAGMSERVSDQDRCRYRHRDRDERLST